MESIQMTVPDMQAIMDRLKRHAQHLSWRGLSWEIRQADDILRFIEDYMQLRKALTEIAEYPLPDELNLAMGEGAADEVDWRKRLCDAIKAARALLEPSGGDDDKR